LPEDRRELLPDQARHDVGRTARRKAHDDADGLGGVGLGRRSDDAEAEQRGGESNSLGDHDVPAKADIGIELRRRHVIGLILRSADAS
jgi:hypothetical protein